MPKIQWLNLLPQLRRHLFDRAKERQITAQDLFELEEWRHPRMFPTVPGTKKTSGRSSGAVRVEHMQEHKVPVGRQTVKWISGQKGV